MQNYKILDSGLNYGFGIFATNIASPDGVSHHGFGHNGVLDGFMSQISISSQNLNNSTTIPEIDPILSPYIIYVQSVNGYLMDISAPIIAMNYYGTTGALNIPQPPRQEDKYPQFLAKYSNTQGIRCETATVPATYTNWNPETQEWDQIEGVQMTIQFEGQGAVALADVSTEQNPFLFSHPPLLFYAQFSQDGNTLIVKQGQGTFELTKQQ
jgi:hypothetical protein